MTAIYRDEVEVNAARPGENLRLRVQGVEEEDISAGFVLSSRFNPVPTVTQFECQIVVMELLEHKPIMAAGYKAILHIHSSEPAAAACLCLGLGFCDSGLPSARDLRL